MGVSWLPNSSPQCVGIYAETSFSLFSSFSSLPSRLPPSGLTSSSGHSAPPCRYWTGWYCQGITSKQGHRERGAVPLGHGPCSCDCDLGGVKQPQELFCSPGEGGVPHPTALWGTAVPPSQWDIAAITGSAPLQTYPSCCRGAETLRLWLRLGLLEIWRSQALARPHLTHPQRM